MAFTLAPQGKVLPRRGHFENQGLFLEEILKEKCLAAGIAGAENRVSGAPLFRDPPAGNRREMGVNRVLGSLGAPFGLLASKSASKILRLGNLDIFYRLKDIEIGQSRCFCAKTTRLPNPDIF